MPSGEPPQVGRCIQVAAEAIQAGALAAGNATAAAAASAVDAAAAAALGNAVGAGAAVGTAINAVCVLVMICAMDGSSSLC
jgi:hypothetical protein